MGCCRLAAAGLRAICLAIPVGFLAVDTLAQAVSSAGHNDLGGAVASVTVLEFVPEPATLALLIVGMGMLVLLRRRRAHR